MYINFVVCVFVRKFNVMMSPADRKVMAMTGVFSVTIINTAAAVPLFLSSWVQTLCRHCCNNYDILVILFLAFLSFVFFLMSLFYFVWLSLLFLALSSIISFLLPFFFHLCVSIYAMYYGNKSATCTSCYFSSDVRFK